MKNKQKNWRSRTKTSWPKELEAIKDNKSDDNEKFLKCNEIFNELSNERISEIYNMSLQSDFNNLTYYLKNQNTTSINFITITDPLHIYSNMKNNNISIEKIKQDQKRFKSKLTEIITGNPKCKSKLIFTIGI